MYGFGHFDNRFERTIQVEFGKVGFAQHRRQLSP
jgi:hypothetical protein